MCENEAKMPAREIVKTVRAINSSPAQAQGGVKKETLLGKALFHLEKKRSGEAIRLLDLCLKKFPDFAAGFDLRSRIHKKMGNKEASKKDWSRYKELKSK